LFLRFQVGVTEQTMAELDHFPILEMVVVSRCGVDIREVNRVVKDTGWKMSK
jgi:hypothetical protein